MIEKEVLKIVVNRLNKTHIGYMISGSIAYMFYATPRMTRDIDIIIDISINDINKIYNTFKDDFYIDKQMILEAIQLHSMFNIIHFETSVKIDFIIRKDEEFRLLEFKRKQKKIIDDLEIFVTTIEDLIISKLYWAKDSLSEMQLRDVKNLLKNEIDSDYVAKWCKKLNITHIFEKVL